MKDYAIAALKASKAIAFDANTHVGPPDDGVPSYSQQVLPKSLYKNTRGYIEKVANQVNGAYEHGWYDSSAVMIRRLIETLIIECFEKYNIPAIIQDSSGDFVYLSDLIDLVIAENKWNLSRNTKASLKKLKHIGDKSAHSRRFNAKRWDIDRVSDDLRTAVEELLYISGLR